MRLVRSLLLALILASALGVVGPEGAVGSETRGVGVLAGAPLVFAADVWSTDAIHTVFAYNPSPGSDTRVVVRRSSGVGPVAVDDEWLPASALQLSQQNGLWVVTLTGTVPSYGEVDLRISSAFGFYSGGMTCAGEFDLQSPSNGLSDVGQISGHVGEHVARESTCLAWGTDAYGYFAIHPVALGPS